MAKDIDVPTEIGGPGETRSVSDTQLAVATAVAQFAEAWHKSSSPELGAYLPAAADVRTICLVELIKVDMHNRSQRSNPKRLAEYLADFPELGTATLPPDLLYEEFHCLRRAGIAVEPTAYGDLLAPRLTAGDYRSTLLAAPRAIDPLTALTAGAEIEDFELLLDAGSGAFARVFLARQRSMRRLVALKISHNHGTEPETLAQLDHPNIVRVFDQRLLAERDLKLMYMEFVPGGTLLDLLKRAARTPPAQRSGDLLFASVDDALSDKGALGAEPASRGTIAGLSWPETVAWLGKYLAEALAYSAGHGVLHRDIKPANVLLAADGTPKLADFNISFDKHIPGASPAAYFGGSLAYMSPEQLEACHPHLPATAASLDGRSDIYALGVMLWELLTGQKPFDDETRAGDSSTSLERMLAIRRRGIPEARRDDLPDDCPATLRRVLLTCLAPTPEYRWSSSAELAQQFALCLDARARNLVDPPRGSIRERLALQPLPVATTALLVGQLLAGAYLFGHNAKLLDRHLPADSESMFHTMLVLVSITVIPLCSGVIAYVCRRVITVPWGVRKGRRYDATTLARARHDTLVCADRMAVITFAGWISALVVLGAAILLSADMPAPLFANIFASHVVAAMIGAVFPFFFVTVHVVRWYYPALLTYGTTTPDDAAQLRRLARRCKQLLLAMALIPALGVAAGIVFLGPADLHMVAGALIGLGVIGAAAIVAAHALFRIVDADLEALVRVASTVAPTADSTG
ncbi:serine/threonine protein kinase [Aldersonia sp. NBC_00410]|uniref:serine/threonine-protein kinase n=1 Tax=Aldersonia sp. NBC_00410 TaxID=2975954 RepID=UPI00224E0127|nr:serine/threonine-protein kinase [Aldersonia sp. NBC_00410]MCX5042236.1 serine/threonine protein kinase [Aldersonia sp. NBC_00410]